MKHGTEAAWVRAMKMKDLMLRIKGNAAKDWIQSALFIGSITFWLWQSQRVASHRC